MNIFHRFALLFAVTTGLAVAAPPNLIYILCDDLAEGDLGVYGQKIIKTPRLDQMASEGTRFTSFYAQPICGSSWAALMAGCYPVCLEEPGNVKNHMTLPHPRDTLLSEIVKGAGYATSQHGKWTSPGTTIAPMISFFDTEEPFLAVDNKFEAAYKKAGGRSKIITYPGEGHSYFNEEKYDKLTIAVADKFPSELRFLE